MSVYRPPPIEQRFSLSNGPVLTDVTSPLSGVVRQIKPIIGPRDIVVTVAMNYFKSGHISHSNIVIIHVYISEFWF